MWNKKEEYFIGINTEKSKKGSSNSLIPLSKPIKLNISHYREHYLEQN